MRTRRSTSACVGVAALILASLLASVANARAATPADGVRSVVVMGDSVAAGEGTRSGYAYQDRVVLPGWVPARASRSSSGPHPGCHRSPRAYGNLVARALGASEKTFACSGASFATGIVGPPSSSSGSMGPAQFGDWAKQQDLNPAYDRARPDLVLVSAGANSVGFERAFSYCVLAARGVSDADAAPIAGSASIADALGRAVATAVRRLTGPVTGAPTPGCTPTNPGAFLQRTVLDRVAGVGTDARALADAIRARGRAAGHIPGVVFVLYPDPLPSSAQAFTGCPDGVGLGAAQLAFMHQMVAQLNGALRGALADVPAVTVVDPAAAFAPHSWCSADPWFYGPSILLTDPSSWAPFHPTVAGQQALADAVLAQLRGTPSAGNPGTV